MRIVLSRWVWGCLLCRQRGRSNNPRHLAGKHEDSVSRCWCKDRKGLCEPMVATIWPTCSSDRGFEHAWRLGLSQACNPARQGLNAPYSSPTLSLATDAVSETEQLVTKYLLTEWINTFWANYSYSPNSSCLCYKLKESNEMIRDICPGPAIIPKLGRQRFT